jgi:hypothetical protein
MFRAIKEVHRPYINLLLSVEKEWNTDYTDETDLHR